MLEEEETKIPHFNMGTAVAFKPDGNGVTFNNFNQKTHKIEKWQSNICFDYDITTTNCHGEKCRRASIDNWCTGCYDEPDYDDIPYLLQKCGLIGWNDNILGEVWGYLDMDTLNKVSEREPTDEELQVRFEEMASVIEEQQSRLVSARVALRSQQEVVDELEASLTKPYELFGISLEEYELFISDVESKSVQRLIHILKTTMKTTDH